MEYIRFSEQTISISILLIGEDRLVTVGGISTAEWLEIPAEMREGLVKSAIDEYEKRNVEFAEWKARRDAFDKRIGL